MATRAALLRAPRPGEIAADAPVDSVDLEVIKALVDWQVAGRRSWLLTVATTWGSSPRPAGSLLAIGADGRQVGSVSGGCVEEDLVARMRAGEFDADLPRLITYGVTREQALRFGLPCGGRLDLVVEAVSTAGPLRALLEAVTARRVLARRLCLTTGEASLHPADPDADFAFDGHDLIKVFGPRWQLIIIGAGAIARYLVPIAMGLDYRVVICDPRADQRLGWDLDGVELVAAMPDDVVRERGNDPRTAVVALTHDPKLDDMALMEALMSRAFYVGALGSQTSSAKRRERLLTLGLPAAAIDRLHGPVGLPIGGRTPPEIAVSVAAALTAARHGRRLVLAPETRGP